MFEKKGRIRYLLEVEKEESARYAHEFSRRKMIELCGDDITDDLSIE